MSLDDLKKLFDGPTASGPSLAPAPDFSTCRQVRLADGTWSDVKEHVKVGVRALLANEYFGLFDEMGGMKSAQTIIAAQFLYLEGVIDRVIVVCPATVRDVWYDKDLGELSLHLFEGLPARISEFHANIRQWDWGDWSKSKNQLRWIITNYEFIGRSKARLQQLKAYSGPRTLLVLDESSAVKSKGALQSKACLELRRACGRVVLLNGTPIADTPLDLMNQGNIMHPGILDCPYVTRFRDRYCVMNPRSDFPQIIGWKNLPDIQHRFAPYVLRRLKVQCLDLPPKLPSVVINVPLTPTTWKHYKAMTKEMITWLTTNRASIAGQAVTKAMRLAQLTSGFIGGVENVVEEDELAHAELPDFLREEAWFLAQDVSDVLPRPPMPRAPVLTTEEISHEKLDALLAFYAEHLAQDPAFKLLVWCRFRAELQRLLEVFQIQFPHVRVASIQGGQKKVERALALRLLHPRTAVAHEPALLAGTYGTGAMGHNFTAAHVAVNMSYDFSLFKFKQSSDRVHRPGQTQAVSYYDMVAVGPDGQQTIDHLILTARKKKDDVAAYTADAWVHALQVE